MDKINTATEDEREKARNLRYKKSVAEGFNLQEIQHELYEISSDCSEIQWCADSDIDELIEALDGDEEEAFEFRIFFSNLSADAERLSDILNDNYVTEYFDDFFAAVAHGCVELIGFDTFEDDYFKMTNYDQEFGKEEAEKRLMRLTKQELIKAAKQCFGIASAILNIRYKYDYLKSSIDVIKGKNHACLEAVKDIEKLYEEATSNEWDRSAKSVRDFDNAVSTLPERIWVE